MWAAIEEYLPVVLTTLILASIPIALVVAWKRRGKASRAYLQSDEATLPIEGTDEERLTSERDQSKWSADLRTHLAKDHEIIGRLNTIDGYSLPYVEDLLSRLGAAGIAAEYHFQETSPIGVGASFIERHGNYEIFVAKDRVEDAVEIVEKLRSEG